MLSTHPDIKVKAGTTGSDRGRLWIAVDLSSLQHVMTKLSYPILLLCERCDLCLSLCVHVAFMCFIVHVHVLPFLSV